MPKQDAKPSKLSRAKSKHPRISMKLWVLLCGVLLVGAGLVTFHVLRLPGTVQINPIDQAAMVWVPAGPFLMGGDTSVSPATPQRQVKVDGYWIYQTEVTVKQYRTFCSQTGRTMPPAPSGGWQDEQPMVAITWFEAEAYAKWAGAALPTSAEWEKAARGTDGRLYPWGNTWNPMKVQCSRVSDFDAKHRVPVGSYPAGASPYGCLDMAGNVSEWCADLYQPSLAWDESTLPPPGSPTATAREQFNAFPRIIRGGDWTRCDRAFFSTAREEYFFPTVAGDTVGFRCVVRPTQQAAPIRSL